MAEINQFLSKDAEKQINKYLQDLKKIAAEYGKLGKVSIDLQKQQQAQLKTEDLIIKQKQQLEKLNQQIAKTDSENLKAQQQLNKVLIDEERIQQQKIKTEKDQLTLSEKKKRASEKERKEVEKQNSAYQKLNKTHQEAIKKAKDLAAQFGIGSKQARKATNEANKLDKQLKKIDSSLGQSQRRVGGYFKDILKGIASFGAGFLGAQGVITLFKKFGTAVVENSQLVSDTLDVMKARFNATFDAIGSAIARGDFSTLADDIRKARQAAEDYTKTQDELADVQRSIRIENSQVESQVYKLREAYTNSSNDIETRLNAVNEANKLLIDLQERRRITAESAIKAEIDLIKDRFSLTEDESKLIDSFITDYGKASSDYNNFIKSNNELLLEREKLQERVSKGTITQVTQYGTLTTLSKDAKQAQKELTKLNETQLSQYNKIALVTDSINDTQRDRFANAKIELTNQERATQRLINETVRQQAAINKSAKQDTQVTSTKIENLNTIDSKTIESVGIGIQGANELTITTEDALERQKKAQEEYDAWYLMSQKEKWANAQQLVSTFSGYAVDAINGIFDFQINALDNELESTDAYYQTKINAASNAGESTIALETQYNLQRQQLEDEKKKREKQAAITNIGLTYAQSAFEIVANAAALSSNPLTIALSPIAWAQLGALTVAQGVQLAAVSQFDDGTGSTPSTYIAGEKRPEFRKHNGQWSLLTEPTLFTDSAGDQIISGAETDQILKGASMQGNTGNAANDTERIVRAIENNTPSMGISKGGLITVSKKNGNRTKYLNDNVRH